MPGLGEVGANEELKNILNNYPCIFICCINYASGFLRKEICGPLIKNVLDQQPSHIIFVLTNVEETLKKESTNNNNEGDPFQDVSID